MEKKTIGAITLIIVFLVVFAMWVRVVTSDGTQNPLPQAKVEFKNSTSSILNITCEIASTPSQQERGLMNRTDLPDDRGMLFVFAAPEKATFWMKNTLIPLDIIFINDSKVVLNIAEAKIETGVPDSMLTRYYSDGLTKWVVEINEGLSSKYGISAGTQVSIEYLT
ncbi:MAG: uncharacterized protein QG670_2734 [Thermoproteota archaeon]|nr:uncharacterized protein [Thermoproteota archaeon]